jgi:hypothetical protein
MNAKLEIQERLNTFKCLQKGLVSAIDMCKQALEGIEIVEQNGNNPELEREIVSILNKGKEPLSSKEIHDRIQARRREKKAKQILDQN